MVQESERKCQKLVLDSGAIIRGDDSIFNLSQEYFTIPEVLSELKDGKVRERLNRLPFDIKVQSPSAKSIARVLQFAKGTGDYSVLSQVDLRVIALTLDLHGDLHGESTVNFTPLQAHTRAGGSVVGRQKSVSSQRPTQQLNEDVAESIQKLSVNDHDSMIDPPQSGSQEDKTAAEADSKDIESDDSDGWITPQNYKTVNSSVAVKDNTPLVQVQCMTTDYAMQNVLLQMKLGVVSVDGLRITQLKQSVLRCHGCFHVTKDMDKKFCPKCGGNTLIRTSMSVDTQTGEVVYHLKRNFQYRVRGTVYSIPEAKGGRDGDMVLREDQKEFQRATHQRKREEQKLEKVLLSGQAYDDYDLDLFSGKGGRGRVQGVNGTIGYGRRNPNEKRRK
ncbi:hypothetical protein MIR68_005377 [Amoeboaphelidium protococcarum]|nr:hypothetical protein MIR68_005377 [Amoeboaphelidium protococcarum]